MVLDERGEALSARHPELEGVEGARNCRVIAVVADDGAIRVHWHVVWFGRGVGEVEVGVECRD